jgi:hypothetical protein
MANDILGKVGQKVGQEIKAITDAYATKVSLGTVISTVDNLDFTPYATKTSLGSANTAITNLQNTRATIASVNNILDGSTKASKIVSSDGEFDTLKVKGSTTIVNTTTVEISDNIIELNLANDDSETAQSSGLNINRGSGEDKASFLWQDSNSLWEAKKGSAYADLKAKDITATNFEGVFKASDGSGILINNVSLGNYASFSNALTTAKTA